MSNPELNNVENPPQLYSKTLILIFSILFSTIFAAALLMLNLRKLQKIKEAFWVLLFSISYMLATAVIIQTFNLSPIMTVIANVIGAAILNEYFWNRYIGGDYHFRKKSWIKPTVISFAIAIGFFLILMGSL